MSDYAEDLKINKFDLETEWLNQPSLYFHYSKLAIDAKLEVDQAKEDLEFTKADLNLNIRSNPGNYNVEKVTNESVAAAMVCDVEYETRVREYNEARHAYETINAAVRAMEQRKSALENLVRLQLSGIHSTPKVDGATQKEMDEVVQESTKQQIRRRRKNKE